MVELADRRSDRGLEAWDAGSGVVGRCLGAAVDVRCGELLD